MRTETKNPVAGGAASRADASTPVSSGDLINPTECPRNRQVRHILKFYELSLSVALVVAEHAYDSGRRT